MARISASISETLKEELYQAATDTDKAICHIISEALVLYLKDPELPRKSSSLNPENSKAFENELRRLSREILSIKEMLQTRSPPPRGSRFF